MYCSATDASLSLHVRDLTDHIDTHEAVGVLGSVLKTQMRVHKACEDKLNLRTKYSRVKITVRKGSPRSPSQQ